MESKERRKSAETKERSRSGSAESGERRRKLWKRHLFSLGQPARPFHMDAPPSSEDALAKIARLEKGDGVWVRRTKVNGGSGRSKSGDDGHVWTYAILKKRSKDSLVFIVNERGSSKECSVKDWTKFVRAVAPEYALEDEEKDRQEVLDAFVGAGGAKPGRREDDVGDDDTGKRIHETDRHMGSTNREKELTLVPTFVGKGNKETGGHENPHVVTPTSCSSLGSADGEKKLVLVPDHEVSMYTLDSEGDAPPAVVLQDHGTSTYSLVGDGGDEDDASSSSSLDSLLALAHRALDGRNISPSEHDHEELSGKEKVQVGDAETGRRIESSNGHIGSSTGRAESSTGEDKLVLVPDLGEENLVLVPDHEVSMYTLGPGGAYTLVGDGGDKDDEDDASSPNGQVLENYNISVAEDDHDISMSTFAAGMKATAGDKNKRRNAAPPQAEIDVPNVDAKADRAATPPTAGRRADDFPARNAPAGATEGLGPRRCAAPRTGGAERDRPLRRPAGRGDPPDGMRSRRPADPPAADPSGRNRRATDLSTGNVGGKVEKRRAVQRLSRSLPPASSSRPNSGLPGEDVGKRRRRELPPPTEAARSIGHGGEAKKNRAVQQGRDVPTHAGLVDTKQNRRKPSTKVQRLSKSLPPTKRVPVSESCKKEIGMGLYRSRKKPTKETENATISHLSKSLQPTQPVETSTPNNKVDFSSSTMTATPSSINGPYLAKEHAEHKPTQHDHDSDEEKNDRQKPTKETVQPAETSTPTNEADFSSSTMTNNSLYVAKEMKKHAEHKSTWHDDDANKEKKDTSDSSRSRNGEVSAALKDRNVSMYTVDGGDAALLSSADSTILLLESVSEQGRDVVAYVPCGSVVLTKEDGERTLPAADGGGGGEVERHRAIRRLSESLRNLVGRSSRSGDGEDDRTLRDGSVFGRTLDCGDSLMLSSAGTAILLVESTSERGRDILAYAPCGAVVTTKNHDATPRAATARLSAHRGQVEMKRAVELLSESLNHIMPPTSDLEEKTSTQQDRKLTKDDETIADHQQPSHDDEEETNILNDDSDRSKNVRADRTAFRRMCNSIMCNGTRSESLDRQKRGPKPRYNSRRVSWSKQLEEQNLECVDAGPSAAAPRSANGGNRVEKRGQLSKSLPPSLPMSISSTLCTACCDSEDEQNNIGAFNESAVTIKHSNSVSHAEC